MNKRKLCIALGSGLVFLSIASGAIASVAWFTVLNGFDVGITGSFVEEWFHTGDGTSANPFVITRPIHYYHLVEFFQRETELPGNQNFGTDYLYFQVGYDLDNDGDLEVFDYDNQGIYTGSADNPSYSNTLNMAYYSGSNALMPIGTNEIPFIGSFDGKASEGIVISNLNICCSETVEIDGNPVTRTASDIGIFGYVADADGNSNPTVIKDSRFNGVTIDLSDVTTTVASSSTGVTHEDSHAGTAYVGYIAGHVHTYANYKAAVPPASATNATPLHDVYVTNATIQGGAGVHCNYGYIGLVDEIDGQEASTVEGEVSEVNTGGGQGQGSEWGGSIDMKAFNNRIYDIFHTKTITYDVNNRYFAYYQDNEMKLSFGRNNTNIQNYLNQDPNVTQTFYNLQGDGLHYLGTGRTATSMDLPGTVMPLLVNDDFSTSSANTGYLIADTRITTSSYNPTSRLVTDGSVRSSSYKICHIGNSLSDTSISEADAYNGTGAGASVTFNNSATEVLTNSAATYTSSGYVLIKDTNNSAHTVRNPNLTGYTKSDNTTPEKLGLKKYNEARESLTSVFTDATLVHGIHFMNKDLAYDSTTSLNTVKLNGTTKTNYAFPKNCVDFHLKENGAINFFGGSYYNLNNTSHADCFFSLSVIERSGDSLTSSSIKKISYIYENNAYDSTDPTSKKYIYRYYGTNYNNGVYSDTNTTTKSADVGDLVFDMRYLSETPPVQNALYYFEVPVNQGEYALHGVSGQDAGGYLMYLDIGTSGEQKEPTVNDENHIDDAPLFTQIDFQINSYVINSCFNVAYVVPSGSTKETFSITISCGTVTYESHAYVCYEVVIINNSGSNFILNALLMDNDDDNNNDYYYMYAIKYNTGARTQYLSSNTYTGTSGGTTMTPTYTSGD